MIADLRVVVSQSVDPGLLGPLPDGVRVEFWTGEVGSAPAGEIDLWVPGWEHSGAAYACLQKEIQPPRVVQLLTSGYEDVLPRLADGAVLCNAAGVHDAIVAEWVVAAILAMLRQLSDFVRAQDAGEIRLAETEALAGRTVLLLGFGSIAAAVEARLLPFEVELLRVGRTARDGVHGATDLPRLLPRAQVVVVLVPLDEKTRGMVDAKFLEALPDGALLVNAARGGVVDQSALATEVGSGRLRAALDVSEPDPLPAHDPLLGLPGLLYTPHVSNVTTRTDANVFGFVGDQIRRLARGESPINIVKPGA